MKSAGLLVALVFSLPAPVMRAPPSARPAVAPNPIQLENARTGTNTWTLTRPAHHGEISGYASLTSVTQGQTIAFSIRTLSPTFRADIYRLGWYHGAGARLVLTRRSLPGHDWLIPAPDATTGLIACNWPAAFAVRTPAAWVTGLYLVKLTASSGRQAYIPFTVRANRPRSTYVLVHAVATDEAYNAWAGKSLYPDLSTNHQRAYMVSFDRPFTGEHGAGDLLNWDYPFAVFLEARGEDVSYVTDLDVDENPGILRSHRAILIAAHSEYWSRSMRDGVEGAIGAGVNLAVFNANTLYWQVRFEPSGRRRDRIEVCYKDAALDPDARTTPSLTTVRWQDPPVNDPETGVLGTIFGGENFQFAPMVITRAHNWVFAGTGLKSGDRLQAMIGWEYQSIDRHTSPPAPLTILAASPTLNGVPPHTLPAVAVMTLYTAPSGATVFDAGTMGWVWQLGPERPGPAAVMTITANVLRHLGASGPAN